MKPFTKKLVLEDGREFYGYGYGADVERVCELVFNTSMVGYQEILSDPSYTGQIVVMTYPLIGNYGITDEDFETKFPSIGGMVVRECNENPSNFRYTKTFSEVLDEQGIPCISGVDTRMITRIIRDEGCQRAAIVNIDESHHPTPDMIDDMLAQVRSKPGTTFIFTSPRGKIHGINPFKAERVRLASGDTDAGALLESWAGISIVESHNIAEKQPHIKVK